MKNKEQLAEDKIKITVCGVKLTGEQVRDLRLELIKSFDRAKPRDKILYGAHHVLYLIECHRDKIMGDNGDDE